MTNTWAPGPLDRVTSDEVTGIDEIVLTGVDIHLEAISDKSFTLIIYGPGGFSVQADLWCHRKPLRAGLLEVNNAPTDLPIDPEVWK